MFKRLSMFLACILIVTACLTGCAPKKAAVKTVAKPAEQTITDMAGRKVTLPGEIKKAYSTSQIGIIMLYTINPDKLSGWGTKLLDEDKKYISSKYYNLPILGVWSGKSGTANIEQIITVHPDVIFSMGTLTQTDIDSANKIQEKTGIPVVMVDESLTKLDKAYAFVGGLIDESKKAKELGDYCSKTISDIKAQVAKIPETSKKKVYYAEGLKGLETDPKGSFHTEVLDLVNGVNVAVVPVQAGYGRATVSLEQLISWNPDVIIVNYDKEVGGGSFNYVTTDSGFGVLKAVKDHKVYQIPCVPNDWFDRPPSVNRIIGVKWLANLLYPDYVKLDMKKELVTFYDKFYHHKLTDKEITELLTNAK